MGDGKTVKGLGVVAPTRGQGEAALLGRAPAGMGGRAPKREGAMER
jgi:hypothetical protein